jgi:hypothetical protein
MPTHCWTKRCEYETLLGEEEARMRSNFNSVLKLVDGVVQAAGPLYWDDGESEAVVAVTISQKGRIAGVSCSPPNFDVSETEWSLTVPPALSKRKFKKGRARATAEICATGEGIETFVYRCDQEVELEE